VQLVSYINISYDMAQQTPAPSYCTFVRNLPPENPHRIYHDTEYGQAVETDEALFELLVLEINQAGLSWNTVLMKRENFRTAYSHYHLSEVAAYSETDRVRLLADAGIIRNRLKIEAIIYNANVILLLQNEFGSFGAWLDHHHPLSLVDWTKLFRKTFKFTGKEIVNEFLMSAGYLPGSHDIDCVMYPLMAYHRRPSG